MRARIEKVDILGWSPSQHHTWIVDPYFGRCFTGYANSFLEVLEDSKYFFCLVTFKYFHLESVRFQCWWCRVVSHIDLDDFTWPFLFLLFIGEGNCRRFNLFMNIRYHPLGVCLVGYLFSYGNCSVTRIYFVICCTC